MDLNFDIRDFVFNTTLSYYVGVSRRSYINGWGNIISMSEAEDS